MTSAEPSTVPLRPADPGAVSGGQLRLYVAIFLVALLLRAGWGTWRLVRAEDPSALEFPDEVQYWSMAGSLWSGHGLQDELGFRATRMPLYPGLLSPLTAMPQGVIVAKVLQWVIGSLTAVFAAATAHHLFGLRSALLAGLLIAVDPFLVFFSSLLLTETAFLAALVALWLILASPVRRRDLSPARGLAVGAVAVVCVYLRESSLGLVVLTLGFVLAACCFDRRAVVGVTLAGGMVFLSLVPWAVRNHEVTGAWRWTTTRGGISLYDGVGPQADGSSDLGSIKQMPAVRGLTEVQWDDYFRRKSFESIRENPGRIVRLAGTKLARMWNPFPNVGTYQSRAVRLIAAAWTLPTFALAAIGVVLLWMRRRREGLWIALFLLLPAIYLSAVHCLFVGSVRYRLGAVPMLSVLAAFAAITLLGRSAARTTTTEPDRAE